jgi:hypothetical protein
MIAHISSVLLHNLPDQNRGIENGQYLKQEHPEQEYLGLRGMSAMFGILRIGGVCGVYAKLR